MEMSLELVELENNLCSALFRKTFQCASQLLPFNMDSDSYIEIQLETVKYIQEFGTGRLQSEFNIQSKQHKKHPNLWLFKYSQLSCDFSSPIVRECRGLILDARSKWRPIAYPYTKFFNYGEQLACEIDWNTAKVYDKVDGSLATLYHYKGEWYVSSSGTPDASGQMPNGQPFSEIFWHIWGKLKYKLPTDTSKCYMFEMFTNKQRIVVPAKQEMLYLHGVRDMQTFQELDPVPIAEKLGYQMPETFPLSTIEQVLEASRKLTPDNAEGYVVVDAKFNRIKIKSPVYVAIAHLRTKDPTNLNYRSMLQVIRTNESSEFLTYFPQWKKLHANVAANYRHLIADIGTLWDAVKNNGTHDSQEFQIAVTKYLASRNWPNKEIYFNIVKRLQGGLYPTVLDFMQNCDIKILLVLVERFGVKVIQSETTRIKPLKDTKKTTNTQNQQNLIQGPPKEPVFDSETPSSSKSTLENDTKTIEIIKDVKTQKSGNKSKSTTAAKTEMKASKAQQRQKAELDELETFLSKLNAQ